MKSSTCPSSPKLTPDILELLEQHPSLKEFILAQQAQISWLQDRVSSLELEVKRLRDGIKLDSHNSSKPPASDLNRSSKSLRRSTGRSPGAQKGHQGHHLEFSEKVDFVEVHPVSYCVECGFDLSEVPVSFLEKRQVFELPPIALEVTEHQSEIKPCPHCACWTQAQFPQGVEVPTQYGSRFKSFLVYLHNYQLLPYRRIKELIEDLLEHQISPATVYNVSQWCSDRLEIFEHFLKQAILSSQVAHFDETGLYEKGKRLWLHSASTSQLTYYFPHSKRGYQAMDEAGILPEFQGIAIHDHWESYQHYSQCQHAFCNVHHLRELIRAEEQDQLSWAKEMKELLLEIKEKVDHAKQKERSQLSRKLQKRYKKRYRRLLTSALKLYPEPEKIPSQRGRRKQTKDKNLLDRLIKYETETLRFMTDFRVPFDNNLSERDLRMMKLKQKISGGFQSEKGTKAFCRIRSLISTLKKEQKPILESLLECFQNQSEFYLSLNL